MSQQNENAENLAPSAKRKVRRVTLIWVVILMAASVVCGGLLASFFILESRKPPFQPQNATPEKIISYQEMELRDSTGEAFATMQAGDGGASIMEMGMLHTLAYSVDHSYLSLMAPYKKALTDESRKGPAISIEEAMKRLRAEKSSGQPLKKLPLSWKDLSSIEVRLNPYEKFSAQFTRWIGHDHETLLKDFTGLTIQDGQSDFNAIATPRNSKVLPVSKVVPIEDLRLVDNNGWRFATLGLTYSGDPAIVFTDNNGGVHVSWILRREPIAPAWWDVVLYEWDQMRIRVQLRPNAPPVLTIFDKIGTSYGFDDDVNNLDLQENGRREFPELWSPDREYNEPIALFDVRGKKIWQAP